MASTDGDAAHRRTTAESCACTRSAGETRCSQDQCDRHDNSMARLPEQCHALCSAEGPVPYYSRSRWTVLTALGIGVFVGCREQPLQPNNRALAARRTAGQQQRGGCGVDCLLVDGMSPLRATVPLADSA